MSLMVIVPTRGRKKQCEKLLASYDATADFADMTFILDPDDVDTYEGLDWKDTQRGILDPRGTLSAKLNHAADMFKGKYDALMFVADDHVFKTDGWDTIMMETLKGMGGTGMVYPDDKRRNDVPEAILISSDVVEVLGHFAEPSLKHYYLDNAWADVGNGAGMLKWCPDAVIPHEHYTMTPGAERDKIYSETEEKYGDVDREAFLKWRSTRLASEVAQLRRAFNRDLDWILGKVLCGLCHGAGDCR